MQSFGWFYRLILQFFKSRNLYMLLDANTVTGSCDCGKCVRCCYDAQSIHHYITYISMHRWPGVGHFQSDFSDQFRFKAQIAKSQQFMLIRASSLAVVQVLGCKCISCDGEFASKCASDCHRRHPTYIGTACADPSNIQ